MSHPDCITNSSSHHNPSAPPAPRPSPPTPAEVIITVNGLISTALAFRLPISHFLSFSDLLAGAFTAFEIPEEEFSVHFHVYRKLLDDGEVACEEMSVFGEEEWQGSVEREFEEDKEIVLWAHFVKNEEEESEEERRVRFASTDEVFNFRGREPVKKKEGSKGLNGDSVNIYPLGMPIPEERYEGKKYFSGEMVVIPEPGWKAKKVLFQPKIAPPFPGFQPPAVPTSATATTEKGKEVASLSNHLTAVPGFDYTAANEEADRTAERIEYVSPPPIFGMDEIGSESEPKSASSVAVEESQESGGLNDSDLADILKDDWLLERTGRAEVEGSQTETTASTGAEGPLAAGTRRDASEEEEVFVPETEETELWTGDAGSKGDENDEESIFVPE